MPDYAQQTWAIGAAGATPLSSTRLNYMEAGIGQAVRKDGGSIITTSGTAVRGLVVRGITGQTADLFQVRDTADAYSLLSVSAGGDVIAQSPTYLSSVQMRSQSSSSSDATPVPYGYGTLSLRAGTAITATRPILGRLFFQGQNSVGTVQSFAEIRGVHSDNTDASEDGSMIFYTQEAGTLRESARMGAGDLGSNVRILNTAATNRALVVRGFSGQSVPILEVQNSAGTVLAAVQATGGFSSTASSGSNGSAAGFFRPSATTDSGLIVRGLSASQTANLQEWQSSANTVLLAVSATGRIELGANWITSPAGLAAGTAPTLPTRPLGYALFTANDGSKIAVPYYTTTS